MVWGTTAKSHKILYEQNAVQPSETFQALGRITGIIYGESAAETILLIPEYTGIQLSLVDDCLVGTYDGTVKIVYN